MERFDAIVVGAGPAGATAAHRLASAGASVLLLDRARFPRDKPCGGGLTGRAMRLLPVPVDPVVEDAATRVHIRCAYRSGFEREAAEPLVYLTRRARLDAFLAERAAAAGADFREGARVIDLEGTTVALAGGGKARADVLIGADGANGIVAGAAGIASEIERGVALEGTRAIAAGSSSSSARCPAATAGCSRRPTISMSASAGGEARARGSGSISAACARRTGSRSTASRACAGTGCRCGVRRPSWRADARR